MGLFGKGRPKKEEAILEEPEVTEEEPEDVEEYEDEEEVEEVKPKKVLKKSEPRYIEVPTFFSNADLDKMTWENNVMLKEMYKVFKEERG